MKKLTQIQIIFCIYPDLLLSTRKLNSYLDRNSKISHFLNISVKNIKVCIKIDEDV